MAQKEIDARSAYLATNGTFASKELACGKIARDAISDDFFFYLIELDTASANPRIVHKIIQIIENCSKTITDSFSLDQFEKILARVNDGLSSFGQTSSVDWFTSLDAIIGLVSENEISISQTGKASGYIFRNNKISSMTNGDSEPAHPLKIFTDVTSGRLVAGDHIFFGNSDFFDSVSLDRLKGVSLIPGVKNKLLDLAKYLRKVKNKSANAVIIVAGDKEEANFDIADEEKPDIIFIDEPEKTWVDYTKEYAVPVWKQVRSSSILLAKSLKKNTAKIVNQAKDNLAQYQKKKQGHKERETVSNSNLIAPGRSNLSTFKIKVRPYTQNTAKSYSNFLLFFKNLTPLWDKASLIFDKNNRKYIYILLIIIVLGIGYLKIEKNNDSKNTKATPTVAINSYNQAEQLFTSTKADLALKKTTSLDGYSQALTLAQAALSDTSVRDKAVKLIAEINVILDKQTKTTRFAGIQSYSLGDQVTETAVNGSTIYGVNKSGKIYAYDTSDHSTKLVASLPANSGSPASLNVTSSSQVLINTDKSMIFSYNISDSTISKLATASGVSFEPAVAIGSYSTNLYLLDSVSGNIWKHVLSGNEYQKGVAYVDPKKTDLKSAISLAVDGNIFTLAKDGTAEKFIKGVADSSFQLKNIPAPTNVITKPSKIFTDGSTVDLFVLDKQGNRILKFDKDGEFINQYVFDGVTVDDFGVNVNLQKIWVAGNSKIYEGAL